MFSALLTMRISPNNHRTIILHQRETPVKMLPVCSFIKPDNLVSALIYRQRLAQVAREVRVKAQSQAEVIREQLQRDDRQQGLDLRGGLRDGQEVVAGCSRVPPTPPSQVRDLFS